MTEQSRSLQFFYHDFCSLFLSIKNLQTLSLTPIKASKILVHTKFAENPEDPIVQLLLKKETPVVFTLDRLGFVSTFTKALLFHFEKTPILDIMLSIINGLFKKNPTAEKPFCHFATILEHQLSPIQSTNPEAQNILLELHLNSFYRKFLEISLPGQVKHSTHIQQFITDTEEVQSAFTTLLKNIEKPPHQNIDKKSVFRHKMVRPNQIGSIHVDACLISHCHLYTTTERFTCSVLHHMYTKYPQEEPHSFKVLAQFTELDRCKHICSYGMWKPLPEDSWAQIYAHITTFINHISCQDLCTFFFDAIWILKHEDFHNTPTKEHLTQYLTTGSKDVCDFYRAKHIAEQCMKCHVKKIDQHYHFIRAHWIAQDLAEQDFALLQKDFPSKAKTPTSF